MKKAYYGIRPIDGGSWAIGDWEFVTSHFKNNVEPEDQGDGTTYEDVWSIKYVGDFTDEEYEKKFPEGEPNW